MALTASVCIQSQGKSGHTLTERAPLSTPSAPAAPPRRWTHQAGGHAKVSAKREAVEPGAGSARGVLGRWPVLRGCQHLKLC